jgi:hypothetical protein
MKEEEAKKKWCPMARSTYVDADGDVAIEDGCIASACMMWRGPHKYLSATTGQFTESDSGYCGLAGKL